MNDWKLGIKNLRQVAKEAADGQHTLAERSALYSAARFIADDIKNHMETYLGAVDPYASEKIGKAVWSVGAILGFDVDNGHDARQHYSWALGNLQTLEGLLAEKFPDD